jgi:hypothetical protein
MRPQATALSAPLNTDQVLAELARIILDLTGVWWDDATRNAVIARRGADGETLDAGTLSSIRSLVPHSAWLGGRIDIVRKDGPLVSELLDWRIRARQSLSDSRVTSLDLDEQAGEIVIGVSDLSASPAVKEALVREGVPEEVIQVRAEMVSELQPSVQDKNRPRIENGFQVSYRRNDGATIVCTHGADIVIGGPQYGFLTNSHCSPDTQIGTTTGHTVHQHLYTSQWLHVVGFELIDAPLFSGPSCGASPRVCRYSDAMFVGYAGSSGGSGFYAGKKIAETSPIGTSSPGGLNVASYRLAPTSSNLITGMVVRKTGRTSGTTQGPVIQTCVDIPAGSVNRYLLCQDRFSGWSREGDSGSPV